MKVVNKQAQDAVAMCIQELEKMKKEGLVGFVLVGETVDGVTKVLGPNTSLGQFVFFEKLLSVHVTTLLQKTQS